MEGTTVDTKYQVVRLLGRGGMGAVYEAVHRGTGRRVALKVIIPEALGEGDVLARFRREARASGAIESQHVVQVLDTGVDPTTSSPYLVMEFLDGEDLAHRIATKGSLPPEVVLRVIAQACAGLARAHRESVIHRDIKPANLFLARRDEGELVVKLLDFGIAKLRPDNLPESIRRKLTRSGSILGSPLYMSPEQIVGAHELDARSDVFSLGVTMYEALSGVTPCDEIANIGRLVIDICGGKGVPLARRAPNLPTAVFAIVDRATALEPGHRYQTAADMQAAIMALLPGGSALAATMLAPPADPLAYDDTQVPETAHVPPRGVTAPIRALGSAPDLAGTVSFAEVSRPSFLPPALAATDGAFSRGPATPRGTSTLPWIAAALAIVAVVCAFVYLRPRPSTSAAPESAPSIEVRSTSPVVTAVATTATAVPAIVPAAPAVEPTSTAAASVVPPRPAKPKPRTKPKTADCNPDYYFDSEGVRRFKEECVQ